MKKTDLQKFEMVTLKRSEIKLHPQNPRIISDGAKKKLAGKMKQLGLLQPLMVNKPTMHLLGGHQRLAVMDKIEKYKDGVNDFEIDVAMCDLAESAELEMLVFLNNGSSQGTWDTELLASINVEAGISFDAMGFDNLDVEMMFDGDGRFTDVFRDSPEVNDTKDALREIKEHRKDSTEKMKEDASIEFYFVVVCKDKSEKEAILRKLKMPLHEKYVSGGIVDSAIND